MQLPKDHQTHDVPRDVGRHTAATHLPSRAGFVDINTIPWGWLGGHVSVDTNERLRGKRILATQGRGH